MAIELKKRIKSLFKSPKEKLKALGPKFRVLRQTLERMSKATDSLAEIVCFFQTISEWHDQGIDDVIFVYEEVNYGQYDELLGMLKMLRRHFQEAGRTPKKWNRTSCGETVTPDKVYLGDVHGIGMMSVEYWRKRQHHPRDPWRTSLLGNFPELAGKNEWDLISKQARDFMNSHIVPMTAILKKLEDFGK